MSYDVQYVVLYVVCGLVWGFGRMWSYVGVCGPVWLSVSKSACKSVCGSVGLSVGL